MTDPRAVALDKMLSLHPELLEAVTCVVMFRAVYGPYVGRLRSTLCRVDQSFRPDAEPWLQAGYSLAVDPDSSADVAIVFATKYREETLSHIARAVGQLQEGGLLIVTASNDLGAASLERRLDELLGDVVSYSKHKCRVIRGRKDSARLNTAVMNLWLNGADFRPVADSGLVACSGVFSANAIDPGSRLLAATLPTTLQGCGADYGAGYGYLSQQVLRHNPGIRAWHLFEAENRALAAARLNLATMHPAIDLHYHWCNLLPESGVGAERSERFDCIVMNPPFHTGKASRPELGQAFIRSAAARLKPRGVLYLVANRHLPYEDTLNRSGLHGECLNAAQGYKVILARHKG
ncbi:class I SAM-dependent methyltransferase [Candidatus Woesearchaeota archaeon]|nr:class I SAM-dependent methyltransferase [Candidatus Woesearchaeota archaeon]